LPLSDIRIIAEGRAGRLVGATWVAHYSFFTQEAVLNATDMLDGYYNIAGLKRQHPLPRLRRTRFQERVTRMIRPILHEAGFAFNRGNMSKRSLQLNTVLDACVSAGHVDGQLSGVGRAR
jgi:hypothetical protein